MTRSKLPKSPLAGFAIWLAFFLLVAAAAWLSRGSVFVVAAACALGGSAAGAATSTLAVSRRMSALTEQQRATRVSEARIRSTIDDLPEIVWRGDGASKRSFISPVWSRATGQSVAEALEDGWMECVHPDDRQRRLAADQIAAAKGEPYRIEYRLRAADGEFHPVIDRAAPSFNGRRDLIGFVGITVDISDHKRIEADLRQRIEDLMRDNQTLQKEAAKLAKRTEAQNESVRGIESECGLRGEFLSALSEQLRGPVGVINEVTGILRSAGQTELRPRQKDRLGSASGELSTLLSRALELAPASDDAQKTGTEQCNVRRLIEQALLTVQVAADERGLAVEGHLDHTLPTRASTDERTVRRAISDLAEAAMKLADKSSLSLHAERLALASGDSNLYLAISVPGQNVPEERLERAFYPAESVAGETAGLGLSPIRRTVEKIGGKVGVKRDEEGRVVFWFTAPLVDLNPHGDPRREQPRLIQEYVNSNYGPVLDLSTGGMRLRCKRPLRGELQVEITDEEEAIQLRAKVVWTKRVGFRAYEVGLSLIDPSPETVSRLGHLAARHRPQRVLSAA